MNPDALARWRTVDALLEEALARDPDERTAYLRATCGGDPPLYAEVVALLEREQEAERMLGDSAEEFLRPMLPALGEMLEVAEDLPPGARIGPYRLERLIGRGGMGNVYLAERADGAFRKTVALKVIRRGLDTDEVLARFRRERQVLAGLDHPNVARLFDGGVTAGGRPFLVMEHVEGEPVTAHCDARRLSVQQRLSLFAQIGDAVAHAHRRLVVHRDLKPSNILVTDDGTVKLLDFGIAKLLEPGHGSESVLTQPGALRLTPDYAAPEQIRGATVTTATDIYSLGVLLYELLAGCRPIDTAGLGPIEREQALLHVEPPPPSTRIADAAARQRGTTVARLRRQVSGDLDTIVLKALRKAPERRYGSVEALLDDLARHARGLPVAARPESTLYRIGRFAKRHRAGVLATAAVILALTTGLAAALWQAGQAAQERDLARSERDKAEQVADFLQDLFSASSPLALEPIRMDTMRVRDFLAVGAAQISADTKKSPDIRAQMLGVIGRAYLDLGLFEEARPLLEEAVGVHRQTHPVPHEDLAGSLTNLAALLSRTGEYEEARQLFTEALAINRQILGDEHEKTGIIKNNLAVLLKDLGELESAETLHREALATLRAQLGDEHPRVAVSLSGLGVLLDTAGRFEEGESALSESVELRRRIYGDGHPNVAVGLANLGGLRHRMGDLDGAEAAAREALEIHRAELGHDHPHVATDLGRMASILRDKGEYERSARYFEEAIELRRSVFGPVSREMGIILNNYASLLRRMGDYDRAEEIIREALAVTRAALGDDHHGVAIAHGSLASILQSKGQHREAVRLYRDALAAMQRTWPGGHLRMSVLEVNLGNTLAELGQFDEAESLLLSGYEGIARHRSPDDPHMVSATESLATFYTARGRVEEAERYR